MTMKFSKVMSYYKGLLRKSYTTLLTRGCMRSRDRLNTLYLYYHKVPGH